MKISGMSLSKTEPQKLDANKSQKVMACFWNKTSSSFMIDWVKNENSSISMMQLGKKTRKMKKKTVHGGGKLANGFL